MNQIEAEAELEWRFYCWAKKFMEREVAEGFPALRACDLNRRVQCGALAERGLSQAAARKYSK
jgi:hypothetical protein